VRVNELVTRERLRAALERETSACPEVLAMWEAGSAAFARNDELSDLDIGFLVRTGTHAAAWAAVDRAVDACGGASLRWNEPNPLWAGMDKRTIRLRRANRWLQLDIGIFEETATELYNEPERHGTAHVCFDRTGRLAPVPWDEAAHLRRLREALHHETMRWRMYHGWFRKELARGRSVDAFAMYLALTVRPLLAVLGMRYRPTRWDFAFRYVREEFPPEVAAAVERLCYLPGPEALEARLTEAEALFEETVSALVSGGLTPHDPKGTDIR
jgi:hypothetical protein